MNQPGRPNQPEQAAEAFHHDPHLPPLPRRRHGVLYPHRHWDGDTDARESFPQQPSALPPTGGAEGPGRLQRGEGVRVVPPLEQPRVVQTQPQHSARLPRHDFFFVCFVFSWTIN